MYNEQDRKNSVSPQEEYKIQKESEAYPQVQGGEESMNHNDYNPQEIYKKVDDQLNRSHFESDDSKSRVLPNEDNGPENPIKNSYNHPPDNA